MLSQYGDDKRTGSQVRGELGNASQKQQSSRMQLQPSLTHKASSSTQRFPPRPHSANPMLVTSAHRKVPKNYAMALDAGGTQERSPVSNDEASSLLTPHETTSEAINESEDVAPTIDGNTTVAEAPRDHTLRGYHIGLAQTKLEEELKNILRRHVGPAHLYGIVQEIKALESTHVEYLKFGKFNHHVLHLICIVESLVNAAISENEHCIETVADILYLIGCTQPEFRIDQQGEDPVTVAQILLQMTEKRFARIEAVLPDAEENKEQLEIFQQRSNSLCLLTGHLIVRKLLSARSLGRALIDFIGQRLPSPNLIDCACSFLMVIGKEMDANADGKMIMTTLLELLKQNDIPHYSTEIRERINDVCEGWYNFCPERPESQILFQIERIKQTEMRDEGALTGLWIRVEVASDICKGRPAHLVVLQDLRTECGISSQFWEAGLCVETRQGDQVDHGSLKLLHDNQFPLSISWQNKPKVMFGFEIRGIDYANDLRKIMDRKPQLVADVVAAVKKNIAIGSCHGMATCKPIVHVQLSGRLSVRATVVPDYLTSSLCQSLKKFIARGDFSKILGRELQSLLGQTRNRIWVPKETVTNPTVIAPVVGWIKVVHVLTGAEMWTLPDIGMDKLHDADVLRTISLLSGFHLGRIIVTLPDGSIVESSTRHRREVDGLLSRLKLSGNWCIIMRT